MPKIARVLNDRQVAALKHVGSENAHSLHAVGGVPGLMLQVTLNGGRSWVMRTPVNGKRKHFGLGSYLDVPLSEARTRAGDIRSAVRAGRDPIEIWTVRSHVREISNMPTGDGMPLPESELYVLAQQKWLADFSRQNGTVKSNNALTFEAAMDDFLHSKLDEFNNEKHQKQWRSTLTTYAVPIIGKKLVDAITVDDMHELLKPIWNTKTETASRVRGRVENVLDWATVKGYRTGDNPARWRGNLDKILPKPSKVAKTTNQPAVQLNEAQAWWIALKKREGMAARALEFLTLCASRSGEIRGATWDEFTELDSDTPLWTISKIRMKAGKEHRIPLSPQAVTLLKGLPRAKDDSTVFFAPRGGPLSDMTISAVMRRLHEGETSLGRKGWVDRQSGRAAVPHGLRSTFRDWTTEQTEYPRDMAEIALAHTVGSEVERAYRRGDMLEKRRAMMVDWAAFLHGAA